MLGLTKKNFLDLIKLHVPLEEHSDMFSGYCPFCYSNEETFLAYFNEQRWNCFSCQQRGTITDFIEKTEKLSKQDAKKFIEQFIHASNKETVVHNPTFELDVSEFNDHTTTNELTPLQKVDNSDLENNSDLDDHTELSTDTYEPEIKISESEFFISDQENIISDIDNITILKKLLSAFLNCSDCDGIAIINSIDNKVIGSSIITLDTDELQTLNSFVKNTLKLANNILGDFDEQHSKLLFRMNITIKSTQKKLVWMPIQSKGKHKYSLFMLLSSHVSEKMILIKLKSHLTKLEFKE